MLRKLFHPKAPVVVLLIATTVALLIYSLGREDAVPAVRYFSYLYSSYALVVTVLALPGACRALIRAVRRSRPYRWLMERLVQLPLFRRWTEDVRFRTRLSLAASAGVNAVFILINLRSGIIGRSVWFISLAVYYFLLTATRTYLVVHDAEEMPLREQRRIYRRVGVMLLMLNVFLGVMLSVMIYFGITKTMRPYLAIANAAYTFFLVIMAVVNVFRFRRYHSPILSAVKVIGLFAALVSILMLQTTMISTFGGNTRFLAVMTGSIGLVVELVMLSVSVYMIAGRKREE